MGATLRTGWRVCGPGQVPSRKRTVEDRRLGLPAAGSLSRALPDAEGRTSRAGSREPRAYVSIRFLCGPDRNSAPLAVTTTISSTVATP